MGINKQNPIYLKEYQKVAKKTERRCNTKKKHNTKRSRRLLTNTFTHNKSNTATNHYKDMQMIIRNIKCHIMQRVVKGSKERKKNVKEKMCYVIKCKITIKKL